MKGRGTTTDEAARVAGGTAVGAVAGPVIGKDAMSTVIGGAVDTVAGEAVAARHALRNIIVASDTPLAIPPSQGRALSAR